MLEDRLKNAKGWLNKARDQLQTAEKYIETRVNWSDAIQAAQQAIELSVKSLLLILNIDFPRQHAWDKDALAQIAAQIKQRELITAMQEQYIFWPTHLPRYLMIVNLWGHTYLPAKYGIEAHNLASPEELFEEPEAKLAVEHAKDCIRAASELSVAPCEKLASITPD